MTKICHETVIGPCITAGATVFGDDKREKHESMKQAIAKACQEVRAERWRDHKLAARIDFYLHGARLKLSDLDNMAKVVLDAAFSSGNFYADRTKDRFVWRLELSKGPAESRQEERTEIWFFDMEAEGEDEGEGAG